ncbi:MAG TPA: redoxin family protein, partial [Blastocatellia bacterium]|nr:redoxin family protein [Blastocatellia bacterium]
MRTRSLVPLVIFLGVVACPAVATAPVPRKSPDLAINLPSGKRTQISSLKGKVILIEFLITTCPHCLRMAQTIGKLDSEMGRQGFQPFAIAFDSDVSSRKAADYAQLLNVPFPVG